MLSAALAAEIRAEIAELTLMTHRPQIAILTLAAMTLALGGCAGGGNRAGPASQEGIARVALSPAQNKVVEDGVRKMVENAAARLKAVTATRIAAQPGVHVCGYVMSKDASGKEGPDLPFYVELREVEGKPVAERGQVGTDLSKLSKIKFVCRHNG
jgi:hypothetical protein